MTADLILRLSELVDDIVEDYDVQIKYNYTGHLGEATSYINVVTSHKRATLHIKAPDTNMGLIEALVRHELAHLDHTNDIIAAYREVVEGELSEEEVRRGKYLEKEVVHFAINVITDHVINQEMDTEAYWPVDFALMESIMPNETREVLTVAALILLSRHPNDFEEVLERGGKKGLLDFTRGEAFQEIREHVLWGSQRLQDGDFKEFVEAIRGLAEHLNRAYRTDDRPWRLMGESTDVIHEGTPQSIKEEKLTEFREDTMVEKIHGESVGQGGEDGLALGERESVEIARELKLPNLLEREMGLERPRQINRYRGISTSLADKKRLVLFDSSNKWLERERDEKEEVWVIVDVSSSMTDTIEGAKMMANTVHHFFKQKTRIIAFDTEAYEVDREKLNKVQAEGGTNISSVAKHLVGYRGEPVAIISDFKFVPTHFHAFMSSLRRRRPRQVMLLPVDRESATRVEGLIESWSDKVRFTIL